MAAVGEVLGRSSAPAHPLRTARHLDCAAGRDTDDRDFKMHPARSPIGRAHENARAARPGETGPETGVCSGAWSGETLTMRRYTPRASGGQITLCIWTWKRTDKESLMIFSASSRRVSGVWPAGTGFNDLCCCAGVSGATQEKSTGQMAAKWCSATFCRAQS